MAESRTCPQCGRALSDSAPKGLCSRCLYEAFLAPPEASAPGSEASDGPAPASGVSSTIRYFGDYELLEEIAHGGMGVVFLARQRSLDRLVAVKLIRAGYLARPDQIVRFRREARAAAGLQHPHIVAIHEVGEHRGQQYYSMDFVAGRSLARVVNERPQPPDLAARWVRTIAGAIHYAHSRGVVHRDLKPSNILIDAAGEPHVADFGLAKFVSEIESGVQEAKTGKRENGKTGTDDAPTADSPPPVFPSSRFPFAASPDAQEPAAASPTLTTSGTILGSPNYMPPEQAEGRHTDITTRTDVWSLGAILYELLTGRPPFNASSSLETIRLVCGQEPVPPRRLNPSIPRDLETICLKCLQKPPARRYATAQELADDLGRFLRREPVRARPIRAPEKLLKWTRRHPARAALIAVSVVGLAAYLVQLFISHARLREQRYAADIYFASQSIERGQVSAGFDTLFAIQADHRNPWERDLRGFEWGYLSWRGRDDLKVLTSKATVRRLSFNSEGTSLRADLERGGAMFWTRRSAVPAAPEPGAPNRRGAFKLADEWVPSTPASKADADAGAEGDDLVPHLGSELGLDPPPAHVARSPSGRLFATVAERSRNIILWRQIRALPKPQAYAECLGSGARFTALAFSPDEEFLASGNADGLIQLWNASSGTQAPNVLASSSANIAELEVRLRRVPRAGDLMATYRGHLGELLHLAYSPDAELLASSATDGTVRIWQGRPSLSDQFVPDIKPPVRFSPDGTQLHAHTLDGRPIILNARTLGLEGRPPAAEWSTDAAAWNGDFRFAVHPDHSFDLVDAHSSSAARIMRLYGHAALVTAAAISPDGRTLASGDREGTIKLWHFATARELLTLDARNEVRQLAFSPDNALLVAGDAAGLLWYWRAPSLDVPSSRGATSPSSIQPHLPP